MQPKCVIWAAGQAFAATEPPTGFFVDGLSALGHRVVPVDTYNLSHAFGYDITRRVILSIVEAEAPHLFLVHPPYDVGDSGLYESLRKQGIVTYGARLDDFFFYGFRPDHPGLLTTRDRCCITTTVCRRSLAFMRQSGLANVFHQKYRVNVEPTEHPPLEKDIDVSFVGGAHAHRVDCVRALVKQGIDVRVWGPGWGDYPDLSHCYSGVCSHEQKVEVFHRSKVHLCLYQGRDDTITPAPIHARVMESLIARALPIYGDHPDVIDFFEPGKEIVLYSSPNDLAQKVKYYLSHAGEREAIVEAGRQRTFREHTVEQWWRDSEQVLAQAQLSPLQRERERERERENPSRPIAPRDTSHDALLIFVHSLMAELYADRGLSQVCDAYTKRAAELGDADLARAIARNLIRTARTGNPCWQTIADSLAVLLSRMGVSGGDAGSALLAAAMAAGHIAEEAGRPQPAFAFYRQAIEIGGDTIATAWSGAGRCASQLGDREVAIECFRTADKTAWDMGLYRNYDGFYDLGLPGLGTDGLGSIEPCFGPKTQLLKLYLAQGDWERFLVTAVPLIRSNVTQFGGATQVMQIPFYERIIPQLWNDGQHEVLAKLAGELLQVAPDDGLRSQLSLLQDLCAQKMRVPRSAA